MNILQTVWNLGRGHNSAIKIAVELHEDEKMHAYSFDPPIECNHMSDIIAGVAEMPGVVTINTIKGEGDYAADLRSGIRVGYESGTDTALLERAVRDTIHEATGREAVLVI